MPYLVLLLINQTISNDLKNQIMLLARKGPVSHLILSI